MRCTPGLIMRTKVLFAENPNPTRDEIKKAISLNLCRCTGYVKIVDAVEAALKNLKDGCSSGNRDIADLSKYSSRDEYQGFSNDADHLLPGNDPAKFDGIGRFHSGYDLSASAGIGQSLPKYKAYETAIGKRKFMNDMQIDEMLHGALRFSDHPRALVVSIDTAEASQIGGVIRIFTASDVPGDRYTGLIINDWPLMVAPGETTRYIGDVIAGVVAVDKDTARKAARMIRVEYEVLEPVSDMHLALEPGSPLVHPGKPNLLEKCIVRRGDPVESIITHSAYRTSGIYETQRVEHAFLETEAALAVPMENGIHLYSQGQGIYVDQQQVASLLGLDEDQVRVTLVPCGKACALVSISYSCANFL